MLLAKASPLQAKQPEAGQAILSKFCVIIRVRM